MSFDDKAFPILQPKAHIAFVLGYDRLLFKNPKEIEAAIAEGKTVLFRSEHAKEVHDFSGVFNSIEVHKDRVEEALTFYERRAASVAKMSGIPYDQSVHGSHRDYLLSVKTDDPYVLFMKQRDIAETAFVLACAGYDYENPNPSVKKYYSGRELIRLFQDTHRLPSTHGVALKKYCDHWSLNTEQVLAGLSFSPWEKLKGKVVSMQKDPHVVGQYHVIMSGTGAGRGESRYTISDGAIEASSDSKRVTRRDMNKTIARELIKVYEDALHKAELTHAAPIMECILDEKRVTPVQLHMSRTLELIEPFKIPDEITHEGSGWQKVQFIQGVTPVRGIAIELKKTRDRWNNGTFEYGGLLPRLGTPGNFQEENESYICMYVPEKGGLETAIDKHGPVNQAFMPRISFTMKPGDVPETLADHSAENVTVRIVSNGREAYVRFDSPRMKS